MSGKVKESRCMGIEQGTQIPKGYVLTHRTEIETSNEPKEARITEIKTLNDKSKEEKTLRK